MPNPPHPISLEAASDYSAKQYYLGKVDSSGFVALPTAITDSVMHIIQNKPAVGEAATCAPIDGGGSSYCILGATLAAGDRVATSTTGKVIAAASTAHCIGTLEVGGDDTEIGVVIFGRPQPDV